MNAVASIAAFHHHQPAKTPMFLAPQTLEAAMELATMMSKSSIVPKDYQGNPGNILIATMWGAEIGLAPLQAMQSIAVINGRPSIWGDAMLALVRGSGLLEYIKEEPTEEGCTCTLKRRGDQFEVARTFTPEDAKRAGLWGKPGPWQQHTKRMMQMRARAFALRDAFADVLRGVHIGEEAQDLPTERHMGPADEVKPEAPALPATRADKARDALAKRKTAALPPPALGDVLSAIASADTLDALKATTALAARLDGRDKDSARAAYTERRQALETPPAGAYDLAAAIAQLQAITDPVTLATTFDSLAQQAPDAAVREALTRAYSEHESTLDQDGAE